MLPPSTPGSNRSSGGPDLIVPGKQPLSREPAQLSTLSCADKCNHALVTDPFRMTPVDHRRAQLHKSPTTASCTIVIETEFTRGVTACIGISHWVARYLGVGDNYEASDLLASGMYASTIAYSPVIAVYDRILCSYP